MIALADGNNFYCSCERVFNPRLEGKPVLVLSNNDGCVISRSEEVKALGVEMGVSAFKMRSFFREHRIHVFSSNYALYGDMSRRMMETFATCAQAMEVYSIDECFLDFDGVKNPVADAWEMRAKVHRWTGLPTNIGIGPTKSLAKAANRLAGSRGGVLMIDRTNADELLESMPVEKVWGIGRRHSLRLREHGIGTARALRDADTGWVRQKMGVVGERLVLELRGIPCLHLDEITSERKNISCAKSFGHPLTGFDEIMEPLANYVATCAEKLRAQKSVATGMQVFLMTNPHALSETQYHPQRTMCLPEATAHTPALIATARELLGKIHRDGFRYKKVGISLLDLRETVQMEMFANVKNGAVKSRLQQVADSLGDSVRWGSMGFGETWGMRSESRSASFTTNWHGLPVARAV